MNKNRKWKFIGILSIIVGIPFLTLIASGITLYIAISSTESPVIESYDKSGKEANEVNNSAKIASIIGIKGELIISDYTPVVKFNKEIKSNKLRLLFRHPTLAKKDFSIILKRDNNNIFSGVKIPILKSAIKWDVVLFSEGIFEIERTSKSKFFEASSILSELNKTKSNVWTISGTLKSDSLDKVTKIDLKP